MRKILLLTVSLSLLVTTHALAFDFASNISSPVDAFHFWEQPSQRLNSVQSITPMTAAPIVVRPGAIPLNVKLPVRLTVNSDVAFWQSLQSIHDKIESLSWKQRLNDPYDSVKQDGFLRALGFKRLAAADRFSADTLNTEQESDTNDYFDTNERSVSFGSSKMLGQQSLVDQNMWPGIDLGSNLNLPLGPPPVRILDPNAANAATATGWSATFHYADSDSKKLPLPKVQLSGRGRLGLTPVSFESLDVYLPVMLYPRTTIVKDSEWHSDGLFFGAYVEGAASSQSALVGGLTQAPSTIVTVGLKTGVNF